MYPFTPFSCTNLLSLFKCWKKGLCNMKRPMPVRLPISGSSQVKLVYFDNSSYNALHSNNTNKKFTKTVLVCLSTFPTITKKHSLCTPMKIIKHGQIGIFQILQPPGSSTDFAFKSVIPIVVIYLQKKEMVTIAWKKGQIKKTLWKTPWLLYDLTLFM